MASVLRGLFFTLLLASGLAYLLSQPNTIETVTTSTPTARAAVNSVEIPKPQVKTTPPKRPSKTSVLEKPSAISSTPFAGLKSFGNAGGGGLISQADQRASAANSFSGSKSAQTSDVQILSASEPQFPEAAKRKNISGYVRLEITIDQTSSVKSIDILESNPEGIFESAAVDSVKNWKFAAAYQNGVPIEGTLKRKIEFKLE